MSFYHKGFPQLAYESDVWEFQLGFLWKRKKNNSPQDFKLHRRNYMKLLSIKWPLKNEVIT